MNKQNDFITTCFLHENDANGLKLYQIREWSKWFYEKTNTFNGALGRQLAYLWPAIANDTQIEVSPSSAIVRLLIKEKFPDENIWNYIDVTN